MKKLVSKKGFTLLEIIIGIALFGIISISIIPLFTYGFIHINRSGNRSVALYEIQRTIETNGVINPTSQTLTLIFDDRNIDIEINTYEVEEVYDKNGNKVSIFYFDAK